MTTRTLSLALCSTLLVACGGGNDDTSSSSEPTLPDNPISPPITPPTTPLPDSQSLKGFDFKGFTTELEPSVGCDTSKPSNNSAQFGKVHFAQTHLLEPSHSFFYLAADRDALIRATVTGNGNAPAIKVEGSHEGKILGSFCLSGPATLPTSVDENELDKATSYIGALPAEWVKPGVSITLTAGNATKTFSADELKINAAPELTLITMDWALYGDDGTKPFTFSDSDKAEFAAKLPVTKVRYAEFPVALALKQLPIQPRESSQNSTGGQSPQPAMISTRVHSCTDDQKNSATCTKWDGVGVNSALQQLVEVLQVANGMNSLSLWYGSPMSNQPNYGGVGGNKTGVGDTYEKVFNHEAGHGFDMPHWGDSLYSRVNANAAQKHPYTGEYGDGGGFGNSWAFDSIDGSFINPICPLTGKERQSPMQRNDKADCEEGSGRTYDHFEDYSALFLYRFFVGAKEVYAGNVNSPRDASGNDRPPFSFPNKQGLPNLVFSPGNTTPKIARWDAVTKDYKEVTPSTVNEDERVFAQKYPLQWDVPVYTLWGSFSNGTPSANIILDPLKYHGNLKKVWDPTNPADFASIKSFKGPEDFYYGADLVVKAVFDNGSEQHALIKKTVRSTDPLSTQSFAHWGVNIPAPMDAKIKSVSLYYRPMDSRYSDNGDVNSDNYRKININSTQNKELTAAKYLDDAKLVMTKNFS